MSLPFKFWRSKAELFTPFFNFSNSAWYSFYEWRKQRSFGKAEVNSTSNLAPVIYTYMLKSKKTYVLWCLKTITYITQPYYVRADFLHSREM